MGGCGAYIGAISARQAIKPVLQATSSRYAQATAVPTYRDFIKMNLF
jgi:hypothetical protein